MDNRSLFGCRHLLCDLHTQHHDGRNRNADGFIKYNWPIGVGR